MRMNDALGGILTYKLAGECRPVGSIARSAGPAAQLASLLCPSAGIKADEHSKSSSSLAALMQSACSCR